jgi:DNA ligase-associated metallophosphoesterase
MIATTVAGETLELYPERAAYWRARETLLVADPHFGKAATFRAAGVYVPEATTAGTLARLDRLVAATRARRIVFLGDFLHAREGRHPDTFAALRAWRDAHASVDITVVRGNHDKRAGDAPAELRMTYVDGPSADGPFALAHHPSRHDGHYVLAGHVHPAAHLTGPGRQHARLPCFHFQRDVGVLPAFGEFTGLATISPLPEDRVYVVSEDGVFEARTESVGAGVVRAPEETRSSSRSTAG